MAAKRQVEPISSIQNTELFQARYPPIRNSARNDAVEMR